MAAKDAVVAGVVLGLVGAGVGYLVGSGKAQAAPPKVIIPRWTTGDVISIGEDVYTVHGVDGTTAQYRLYTGYWPYDTLSGWDDITYIDRVSSYVAHVEIQYPV